MKDGTEDQGGNRRESRLPWSPMGIAVLSLLLSPLPAGVLHALNYARLGAPGRQRLALFSNLITGIAVLVFPVFLPTFSRPVAVLFVSAYFYKSQENLFLAHRAKGGQKASLLLSWCLSIVAMLVLAGTLLFLTELLAR